VTSDGRYGQTQPHDPAISIAPVHLNHDRIAAQTQHQPFGAIAEARWLLVEQNTIGITVALLVVVVFWLTLLFLSFGLFAPRNATAILALFLCALAVAVQSKPRRS
jgi:hypothetical protein